MKNKIQNNFIITMFLIALISCSKEQTKEVVCKSLSNENIQAVTMSAIASNLPVFIELEPNNTLVQANGLVYQGNRITGAMNVSNDNDWFKIDCDANDTIYFYLDASAPYISGRLYNQSGIFIKYINFHENTSYICPQDGYFYILISTGNYPGINYTLDLTGISTVIESEPNNTIGTYDYFEHLKRHFVGVCDNSNFDYTLTGFSYGQHKFQLDASAIYCNAQVLDEAGHIVGNINAGGSYTIISTGIFYVRISGYPNIRYRLTLIDL